MRRTAARCGAFVLLMASTGLFLAPNAFAYIDPGSGSYIIQILVASALGLSVAIGVFWGKIRSFFGRVFSKKER